MDQTRIAELEQLKQEYELAISEKHKQLINQHVNKHINGLSDEGIARVNGVTRRTITNVRNKYKDYVAVLEELRDLQLEQEQEQVENKSITDINVNVEIHSVLRLVLTRAKAGSIKDCELILKYSDKFVEIDKKLQQGSTDLESILESIDDL